MAVEYEISSDVATIKDVAPNTQVARVVSLYSGQITYDDEAGSKFATATIDGKSQRVMLCIAVNGTVNYDDVPSLYSTVDGHRCLNIVAPTETGTPDDVPSLCETVVIDGMNVRAVRCILINETPIYDGVSSTCTFVANGKTHTAQLVNQITGGSVDVIVKGASPLVLPDAIANSLSYVKAFGGTEQRNIPQQYTQVNYVTNTSSTVLNTGVVFNFAKNYELELRVRAVSGSWYMFQSRKTSSGEDNQINGLSGSQNTLAISANFNGTQATSNISRTVGNILYVKMTAINGVLTLYVRDETAGTEDTVTDTYTVEDTDALSWVGLWGNKASNKVDVNADVYMARIIEDGVTVMDYVACRQATTAGFYDNVSKTFKTTTNLVADGNTVPTPDTPVNIVCNNGTIKVRRQSGLPLDYQKITFVRPDESIDLGIKTTNNTQITTEFYREANIAQYLYLSDSGSSLTTNTTAYTSNGTANWRFGNKTASITTPVTTKTIYVQNKKGVRRTSPTEDSWDYLSVNSFTSTNNLKTGAAPSTETEGNIRYYSMLVEESGVAVLDLIPVRRLSDDKIGFYNLVNGDFFEATGNVVRGGDIADPIEIYVDGTVETINAHGKNIFDRDAVDQNFVSRKIKNNNGEEINDATSSYSTTYIKVSPSTSYTFSWVGDSAVIQRIYYYTKNKQWISRTQGTFGQSPAIFTTPDNCEYIQVQKQNGAYIAATNIQLEKGSTATEYQPYYDGGTATAEMLLKVGDYTDVQEILSGNVKRNVGIKVLDGTENWTYNNSYNRYNVATLLPDAVAPNSDFLCTHGVTSANTNDTWSIKASGTFAFYDDKTRFATAQDFKDYLADQYAAGTPVIVVYPLATTTTESVTGQTLQVQAGDNTLEITQASLTGLELEAKYKAGVSLTVQEVEDANLDPNVQVTIN